MDEPLITTEFEDAIIRLRSYPATNGGVDPVVLRERKLTEQAARRILNIFHDVSQEFIRIELGIEGGDHWV